MLYDQALLARVYLHALAGHRRGAAPPGARRDVDYVLRDLRHRAGGFFSAEDADSEGEEGRFYIWTPEQIREVLGDATPTTAAAWWGVGPDGELRGPHDPQPHARPGRAGPAAATSRRPGRRCSAARAAGAARPRRQGPHRVERADDRHAGRGRGRHRRAGLVADAEQAADFLVDELRRDDGRWLRSWQQDGGARHLAFAADHAALVDAFTRLAEATGRGPLDRRGPHHRRRAARPVPRTRPAASSRPAATARRSWPAPKDVMDNATPAANTLAASGLLRSAALTGEDRYRRAADDVLELLGEVAAQHPSAFANLLAAAEMDAVGLTEVAVVGDGPELVARRAAGVPPERRAGVGRAVPLAAVGGPRATATPTCAATTPAGHP